MHNMRLLASGRLARQILGERGLLPHESMPPCHEQRRAIQLFDIFDKEKARQRAKDIQEEMKRGYFDDFKDLKETQGRMFDASERLSPAGTSQQMPNIAVVEPSGREVAFPPPAGSFRAALLCVAFRAGAEDKLQSWSSPFREAVAGHQGARWLELSLVESFVMSLWPFRQMILRSGSTSPQTTMQSSDAALGEHSSVRPESIFHFGDASEIRRCFGMTNRLTGYAYLLDGKGRVRWRASGTATEAEALNLKSCAQELLSRSS